MLFISFVFSITLNFFVRFCVSTEALSINIFNSEPAPRTKENQQISKLILQIYADYNKRLGAYKTAHVLQRDYGIKISVGRVYRLMKTLQLPRMSTEKPFHFSKQKDTGSYTNFLRQEFNQKSPNTVWASDFTYIKAGGKWYYLCIVMDLFSRKEEINRKTYHSLQELQVAVFAYIEGFYNSKRPHGSLGMLTPNQKEDLFWKSS